MTVDIGVRAAVMEARVLALHPNVERVGGPGFGQSVSNSTAGHAEREFFLSESQPPTSSRMGRASSGRIRTGRSAASRT